VLLPEHKAKNYFKKFAPQAVRAIFSSQFSLFLPPKQSVLALKNAFLTKPTSFSQQCKGTQKAKIIIFIWSFYHKKNFKKSLLP
jgi:hypothetical protein